MAYQRTHVECLLFWIRGKEVGVDKAVGDEGGMVRIVGKRVVY